MNLFASWTRRRRHTTSATAFAGEGGLNLLLSPVTSTFACSIRLPIRPPLMPCRGVRICLRNFTKMAKSIWNRPLVVVAFNPIWTWTLPPCRVWGLLVHSRGGRNWWRHAGTTRSLFRHFCPSRGKRWRFVITPLSPILLICQSQSSTLKEDH